MELDRERHFGNIMNRAYYQLRHLVITIMCHQNAERKKTQQTPLKKTHSKGQNTLLTFFRVNQKLHVFIVKSLA